MYHIDADKTYREKNKTGTSQSIEKKSWKQHPTKQQQYSHLTLISKTIQIRLTRHAGYCWRSKDELISDPLNMDVPLNLPTTAQYRHRI